LVLAPKNNDASRGFTLHIESRDANDNRLLTAQLATGFVANETRYVKLIIHKECVQSPATCAVGETCNVWSVELAAEQLSRKAQEPHELDATCSPQNDMTPPSSSNAGAGGMMQTDTGNVGDAGSGPTTGAGGVGSTTVNGQNGTCSLGYVLTANTCVDIDECANGNPCGDHGRCQNVPSDYVCECDPGYQNTSGTCVAIENCQTNNGGCASTCTNSATGVVCACGKGQLLKSDRKSCGKFGPPKRLSISPSASMRPMEPHFAFDGEGNGLAVWVESDGTNGTLWSRRYFAGTGWGASVAIMDSDSGSASSPRVALDAQGRGVVVWAQTANSDSDVWAVRYSGETFAKPTRIDIANTGSAYDPSVELNDNGDGFAVWTQRGGTESQIWTNRLSADDGWAGPRASATPSSGGAFSPQVALDTHGNASLVWTESMFVDMTTPGFSPWAARFDPASGSWQPGIALDVNGSAGFPNGQVFGPEGNGLAVWWRITGGRMSIRASKYTESAGWSDSIDITAADSALMFPSVLPRVALSPSGIGAAIWTQYDGSQTGVWANRYEGASAHWSGATRLSAIDSTTAPLPQLAVDPSGDGFAVWSEVRQTSRIIKAWRLRADGVPATNITLSTDVTADPPMNSEVQIDVDAQGNAMAIWDVWEMGQYHVTASAFE
jgi:hypothetical protein